VRVVTSAQILWGIPRPPLHEQSYTAERSEALPGSFQMLARLGDVIYSFGCIVAAVIVGIGVFDYWFGQGGLIVFLSWTVLAAILWAIASAIRYILSGRL
jgi:hypothetical protein